MLKADGSGGASFGASTSKVTTYPASVIATTESRTNTAYGLMTTPDRVQNVVLPANGLIVVRFQGTWQESVISAARASIFVGATQLKVASSAAAPDIQEAATATGSSALDTPLGSFSLGLASINQTASFGGDVTTGQAEGVAGNTGGNGARYYVGATQMTQNQVAGLGGPVAIFAAAGTYDISVQYKSSSGSVTVKNRKLWVEVHDFS